MEWALLVASVALVVVTAGLVYFTYGIVAEAQRTRAEMRATRAEMEEERRLGVRPHLSLEPVMLGPVYAFLGVRNLGPGAARNVSLTVEFEPFGDVRELSTPVILPGRAEEFVLPESIGDLDSAQAADLVSRVGGMMEDVYGDSFAIDLVFEWAPWVEKLTEAKRRSHQEPLKPKPVEKALDAIAKELRGIKNQAGPDPLGR